MKRFTLFCLKEAESLSTRFLTSLPQLCVLNVQCVEPAASELQSER